MSKKNLTFETAPEFVRTGEAAKLLNCHINTIQNWIKAGRLPAERLGDSNRWRIRTSDLAAVVGLTLDANGRIAGDDGTLLAHYAKRFDEAIARLRAANEARGEALTELQRLVDEMKGEGGE